MISRDHPSVLWAGALDSEDTVYTSSASSPAGVRWQMGLLRALRAAGCAVACLSHAPERIWPRGRALVSGKVQALSGIPVTFVGYPNLPWFRNRFLVRNYVRQEVAHSRDYLITYNLQPQHQAIGRAHARRGGKWFTVCADMNAEEELQVGAAMEGGCAGVVFLSWGAYNRFPSINRLHLDGGIDALRRTEASLAPGPDRPARILAYTGTLGYGGGVELAIEAFKLIADRNVELWITGAGTNRSLTNALQCDHRIKYFGMLPEAQLQVLASQVDVFLNPRPPGVYRNRNNFPSKIFEYMSWGGPVVTTWTEGLHPEYRNYTVPVDGESVPAFAAAILEVLNWPEELRIRHRQSVLKWGATEKNWQHQAARLLAWLGAVERSVV